MKVSSKIIAVTALALLSVFNVMAQPVWVNGTPSVSATGPLSITLNYGLDRPGTVYILVFDFENLSELTSLYVRSRSLFGPGGTIVATDVRSVRKGDSNKILQTILNVQSAGQIHTIYIVAADSRGFLQPFPIRLTVSTPGCPAANAGSGGNECDRNFALNAVPVLGTGTWTKITGPGNAAYSPNNHAPGAVVTVTVYGTYTFRWTEVGGSCTSSGDITVNFYQPPVSNPGSGGNVCGRDFVLSAVPDVGTGRWTMTSGKGTAIFTPDATNPHATVRVSEYGTKVFTWTVVNGQCSASSNITVNFYQQPEANAGEGGNNCGREILLNAVPSVGTGTWTRVSGPGNVVFSPNANTPGAKATVSVYGTYVLRWTEVNGPCRNSESITLTFYQYLSANAGNGGDECDRNFILNAVPGTGTGTWTKVSGPGTATFSPDPHRYNAVVTVSGSGSYDFAWTEVNFNCSSTDIIRVVFHVAPAVNAGQDAAICRGGSIKLYATGSGNFLWSPANVLNNPAIADPLATPVANTVFTVRLSDQWGCANSDQVTVSVRERPVANAGPDQLLKNVFWTSLAASELNSYESGVWTVVSGTAVFNDKNDNNTIVNELSIGENRLVWTVSNGVCSTFSDTVNINVNDLTIPTLITPNMDGKNDIFFINGIETFGKTELTVFNRWGALVYRDRNYTGNNNWDGQDLEGKPLLEDTYFYILKPEKYNQISGYIVIRR
ncbi:MAG: gliding motility-associated C-terminal domain-containing protein [Bacteroidales bacterium]